MSSKDVYVYRVWYFGKLWLRVIAERRGNPGRSLDFVRSDEKLN